MIHKISALLLVFTLTVLVGCTTTGGYGAAGADQQQSYGKHDGWKSR